MGGGLDDLDAKRPALVGGDPLHGHTSPDLHWSRSNVAEAVPGVPTPLSWSLWGTSVERGMRRVAHEMGILGRADLPLPEPDQRYVRIFFGRPALQVEFLAMLGDRAPGSTGEEAVAGVLGRVPAEMTFHPTRRRYPLVAVRFPHLFVTAPRQLRHKVTPHDAWYQRHVAAAPTLSEQEAVAAFAQAARTFEAMLTLQLRILLGVVQPVHTALERLVARVGVADPALLAGDGGAEVTGLVGDLWRTSRGQLPLERVVERHGFHGPAEGELSSAVWRERRDPLQRIVDQYRGMDDVDSPMARAERRQVLRRHAHHQVLDALPRHRRPGAAAVLDLAASRIPLRGVAKRCFLQAFDVARATARRAGMLLGLDDPDDIFYLTTDELVLPLPADAQTLISERREARRGYERLELPDSWRGMPTPTEATSDPQPVGAIDGIGVSAGVAQGRARVLPAPDFDDVEPGEILVAAMTDPSWSTVMMLSAALVMDGGGSLSHAAVVARELEIPCVVNTRVGTKHIRTGDVIRVDGTTGLVTILRRQPI
jgi:pyruvate,water dikinase